MVDFFLRMPVMGTKLEYFLVENVIHFLIFQFIAVNEMNCDSGSEVF